jgi:hypothetical protein
MNLHRPYAVVSPIFRRRRMQWFRAAINTQADDTGLDVGGTSEFRQSTAKTNEPLKVTLLNQPGTPPPVPAAGNFNSSKATAAPCPSQTRVSTSCFRMTPSSASALGGAPRPSPPRPEA